MTFCWYVENFRPLQPLVSVTITFSLSKLARTCDEFEAVFGFAAAAGASELPFFVLRFNSAC